MGRWRIDQGPKKMYNVSTLIVLCVIVPFLRLLIPGVIDLFN